MRLQDLQDIDVNDISSWPLWLKIAATLLIGGAIVFAGYWFIIKGEIEELRRAERKEQELRQTFLSKKALAVNLPAYRQQMKEMQESFGVLLRQLPDKTEVPELLIDITQAGLGRGLEFIQFKPEQKRNADFYAVLPVSIKVVGSYHQLSEFVSDLAALPRIVTVGNINISGTKDSNQLTMTASTRTYHYLDEEEIQAQQAAKPGKATTRVTR